MSSHELSSSCKNANWGISRGPSAKSIDARPGTSLRDAHQTRMSDVYRTLQRLTFDHGFPWSNPAGMCAWAAERGDINLLKYLVTNGCEPGQQAYDSAAEHGQVACLRYLCEDTRFIVRESDMNMKQTVKRAMQFDRLDCIKYLQRQGVLREFKGFCLYASRFGAINCLKWLREEYNCRMVGAECLQAATFHGHLAVVKYLHQKHHCDWFNDSQRSQSKMWEAQRLANECHRVKDCVHYLCSIGMFPEEVCQASGFIPNKPDRFRFLSAMSALDEFRESLTDGSYKEIAEALMVAHKNNMHKRKRTDGDSD